MFTLKLVLITKDSSSIKVLKLSISVSEFKHLNIILLYLFALTGFFLKLNKKNVLQYGIQSANINKKKITRETQNEIQFEPQN